MTLIKVHVYELKIGMFISELEIPWEESPFLLQGFDLKSQADIKAVQDVCEYVMIDPERQKAVHGAISKKTEQPFLQAFEKSATAYQQTSSLVKGIMDDIRFGNQLNAKAAKEAALSKDFLIGARIESFIVGNGLSDAIKRAEAYSKAGADLILIHSKKSKPSEIFAFAKKFAKSKYYKPMVAVPSTYSSTTEIELIKPIVVMLRFLNKPP